VEIGVCDGAGVRGGGGGGLVDLHAKKMAGTLGKGSCAFICHSRFAVQPSEGYMSHPSKIHGCLLASNESL